MMLLDLPAEIINLIVGYLAPPFKFSHSGWQTPGEACPCHTQTDRNRQLPLWAPRFSRRGEAHPTDALRFGMAHPYIARCIGSGAWKGVVNALVVIHTREPMASLWMPKELRRVVRRINFSLCDHELCYRPPNNDPAGSPDPTTLATTTLQSLLCQFSSVDRLDIHTVDHRRSDFPGRLFGEDSTRIHDVEVTDTISGLEPPCRIKSLFINEGECLNDVATILPLQLLSHLQVWERSYVGSDTSPEEIEGYRAVLERLEGVVVNLESLESVQVCILVMFERRIKRIEVWNLWETALASLFEACRSKPSCKIGLCITYMVFDGELYYLEDCVFQPLPDGTHTLLPELAPRNESDVRAFIDQPRPYATPQFQLTVNFCVEDGVPEELVKVTYSPPRQDSSSRSIIAPGEGSLECHFHREGIDGLYHCVRDDWLDGTDVGVTSEEV